MAAGGVVFGGGWGGGVAGFRCLRPILPVSKRIMASNRFNSLGTGTNTISMNLCGTAGAPDRCCVTANANGTSQFFVKFDSPTAGSTLSG